MRVAILRRVPKFSVSMDVHADGLVSGLKAVRPDWTVLESCPVSKADGVSNRFASVQKYYERYQRYPRSLSQLDADIFHIIDHSDGYLSAWLRRTQSPNVVTCHDLINLIEPETFKGRAKFPLVSMTLWKRAVEGMRQANHVIAVSSHTKKDTVEHLGISPQDITVVPNAVDRSFCRLPASEVQTLRHQHNLSPETLCLLNVGSNNARKNISTILSVVALLKQQGLPICFWKAGADFNPEQKQFIESHNLSKCISYLGKPDKAALIGLYNSANCLMAPSLYEGFGFTILEAMACGLPVITANVTAMPEVAGNAAVLVNPLDIEAMAQAVQRLYAHPTERQTLAAKGIERAKVFTWESTAEQVARVYERVLGQVESPTGAMSTLLQSS